MSVLIKGMEMPKAGNWKTIRIYYDGTCVEPNWQGDCRYMQGCEAVFVPPHGRLIDADELKIMMPTIGDEYLYAREMIEEAPTIIEAEEEQE